MFRSFWLIGTCPLVGHSVQLSVRTVATLEEEPKNWKLILILFGHAIYIRNKIKFEKSSNEF